jgi:hypothetical protein
MTPASRKDNGVSCYSYPLFYQRTGTILVATRNASSATVGTTRRIGLVTPICGRLWIVSSSVESVLQGDRAEFQLFQR